MPKNEVNSSNSNGHVFCWMNFCNGLKLFFKTWRWVKDLPPYHLAQESIDYIGQSPFLVELLHQFQPGWRLQTNFHKWSRMSGSPGDRLKAERKGKTMEQQKKYLQAPWKIWIFCNEYLLPRPLDFEAVFEDRMRLHQPAWNHKSTGYLGGGWALALRT